MNKGAALYDVNSGNLFLQRSDPLAHLVYPMTKSLSNFFDYRFLKLDVVQNITMETPTFVGSAHRVKDNYTFKNLFKVAHWVNFDDF